jgi:peptidoglycan/LPS O-acetylase OafA/YrhL
LLAYLVLVAAYHPWLSWPAFNRIGDYSYGVYVYAFPIQQTLVERIPLIEPLPLFALALPATLAVAALSWHFVEAPALGLKSRFRQT